MSRREVWNALKTHLPELAVQMPEITRVFGPLDGVSVKTTDGEISWQRNPAFDRAVGE